MRKTIGILAAAAAVSVAAPAVAAPIITSAVVSGPTGTVWDTAVNGFYTLFIQRPTGNVLNPNDNFTGAAVADPVSDEFGYSLAGDGWPTAAGPGVGSTRFPNSDPFYTLTLTITEGGKTGTLSGTYNPSTDLFTATTGQVLLASGNYSLAAFDWTRGLSNIVGAYSSTNTAFDRRTSPGSGRDYQGSFTLNASAVPEPATWGLMILGFGVVGGALRSRRKGAVATA